MLEFRKHLAVIMAFALLITSLPVYAEDPEAVVTGKGVDILAAEEVAEQAAEEETFSGTNSRSSFSTVSGPRTSAVKDQGEGELSWAFSLTSQAESYLNWYPKGVVWGTGIYSSLQLAAYVYGSRNDPLGNATGDTSSVTYDILNGCNDRSHIAAAFGAAAWANGAKEETLPYTEENIAKVKEGTLDSSYNYDYDEMHLYEATFIDSARYSARDYRAILQNYIVSKGGITVGIGFDESSEYYNSTNGSYYSDISREINHFVTLVGWNDNYPADNFSAAPAADGAWLVQDCRGTSFGTDGDADPENSGAAGYFWVSYYDRSLGSVAVAYMFNSADYYQHNYMYDGGISTDFMEFESGTQVGAKYTIKARDDGDGREKITAVNIAFGSEVTSGTVYIIKNTDAGKNIEGEVVAQQTFSCVRAGIHTIDIDGPVLNQGDSFTVLVEFSRHSAVYYDADVSGAEIATNGDIINSVSTENDLTFVKNGDEVDWLDSETLRIKVFTNDVYSVSFDANGGTGAPSETTKIHGRDLNLNFYSWPTKTNYSFSGWGLYPWKEGTLHLHGDPFYRDNKSGTLYAVYSSSNSELYPETPALDLSTLTVEKKTCQRGEEVKVSLKADTTLQTIELFYEGLMLEPMTVSLAYDSGSGLFEGTLATGALGELIDISEPPLGKYRLVRIEAAAESAGYTIVRDGEKYPDPVSGITIYGVHDLSAGDFTITDGSGTEDTEAPVIDYDSITFGEAVYGEPVHVSVKITDASELISAVIKVMIPEEDRIGTGTGPEAASCSLQYNDTTGLYEGDLENLPVPGKYALYGIGAVDLCGNITETLNTGSFPELSSVTDIRGKMDLSSKCILYGVRASACDVIFANDPSDNAASLTGGKIDLTAEAYAGLLKEEYYPWVGFDLSYTGTPLTNNILSFKAPSGTAEGDTVLVRQLKSDSSVQEFTSAVKNGRVEISVEEVSVYMLLLDRQDGLKKVLTYNRIQGTDQMVTFVSGGGDFHAYPGTTLQAMENVEGFDFVGWFENYSASSNGTLCSDRLSVHITPDEDIALTAVYRPKSGYTFNVSVTGEKFTMSGISKEKTGSGLFAAYAGSTLKVNYTDTSRRFLGWANGDMQLLTTDKEYSFVLIADTEIHAVTVPLTAANTQGTVTFKTYSGGTLTTAVCRVGEDIELPDAPPVEGMHFVRWSKTPVMIWAALASSTSVEVTPVYAAD